VTGLRARQSAVRLQARVKDLSLRQMCRPDQGLAKGTGYSFSAVKRTKRKADNSPSANTEVKNMSS
jgi:hypothetical protein